MGQRIFRRNGWLGGILSVGLCLALVFSVVGAARADGRILGKDNAGSMTFTLYSGEYAITQDKESLDVVQMEGFSATTSPGDPMLPHKVYNIAVPPDIVWSSLKLNIVSAETSVLEGTYDITPAGPDIARVDDKLIEDWGEGKDIVNGRNMEVYGTDADFPESYLQLLPCSQMRKWKYITVDFTPLQYNPVSQKLTLTQSVTIEITYEQSGIEPQASLMDDTVMDDVAAQILFNYQQAKSMYKPGAISDAPSVTYDYVIITTNAIEANSAKLASFVSHKESQGHSVLVITEDEFGGLAGQAPNHKAEKIRKWLIDNYAAMGIEYVLLIGDPHPYESTEGDIPMKMCWPRHGVGDGYEESPTDYFYADLTGNWDHDGDGYYGEWTDDYLVSGGVDFAPEVYVGRIPVYGAAYTTLDSILQKIIDYETEASIDWRESALLPMGFQSAGYDGAPLSEQMRDDYLNAAGFSSWRMYQQGSGACGVNSIYTSEEELRGGTVVRDRWAASDYGVVCWWGHGNPTLTEVGYDGCWDGTLFQSSYCSSLDDDHPSFTYQCSCTNGYPEDSNNLQYAILKQGGIGTVSATRVSWFSTGVGYGDFDGSTTNSGIGYEYVSRLVADNLAGEALYSAKLSVIGGLSGNTRLMNFYDFNLYGDPTTSLSSQGGEPNITVTPPSFDVSLPPNATQGYALTISNSGAANLSYNISDRTTGGGGLGGTEALLLRPASAVLEIPLAGDVLEPEEIGASGWQNITTEGFEGAFPGSNWTLYGDPTWDDDDYKPHTGGKSGWCAGSAYDPEFYYYPNDMESWMVYGPFSLSDATDAELNFWFWLQSEENHDYFKWLASSNGTYFYGWQLSGDSGGWVSQSFDLTDVYTLGNLCGEAEVWIAFIFTSDSSNVYDGAFVDDVVLQKYVAGVNNPPNIPSSPSPANHTTGVSIYSDLSWTGGDPDPGDTVTYDVYFDTTGATTLVSNDQSGTTYDPGTLGYNTEYYWKIVATDNHTESTTGPVWDFTTEEAAEDCLWLTETPISGSVEVGSPDNITVTINTTGLGSNYTAEIVIANNDPDENPTIVPVTLHVTAVPCNLTISSTDGGNVTTPGEGTYSYNESEVVHLVATPDLGYHFVNWTGDVGTIANVNSATTNITMNGNYTIVANFAIDRYNLNISSTSGGNVTTPGEGTFTYNYGTVVNLVATADANHHFVNWTGNVGTVANVNSATTNITMNGNYSIVANFEEHLPKICVSPSSLPLTVAPNTTVTATYTITNCGGGTLNWDSSNVTYVLNGNMTWLTQNITSGTLTANASQTVLVTVNTTGLAVGNYTAFITITGSTFIPPVIVVINPTTGIDVMRDLPGNALMPNETYPGGTFDVYVNFTAPADDFNAIGLTDVAPDGWTVRVDKNWTYPTAYSVEARGNKVEILWSGPFSSGTNFSVLYKVTVPETAKPGINLFPQYDISKAWVGYYVAELGPYTSCVWGDYQMVITVPGKVIGETRDVNANPLSAVNVTLLKEGEGAVISDASTPNYSNTAYRTGQYWLCATRVRYYEINITGMTMLPDYYINLTTPELLAPGCVFDFEGNYGLVPRACDMSYALKSVNLWLVPPVDHPEWGIDEWKAMDSIHSWQYPS